MRICPCCKVEKELVEFNKVTQRGKLSYTYCKPCTRIKDQRPASRFSRARVVARKHKIDFTISREFYIELISKPCYYCGESLEGSSGHSLDRLDPHRGYHVDNVVQSCWICNFVKKNTFYPEEMKQIGALFNGMREARKKMGRPELIPQFTEVTKRPKHWKLNQLRWEKGIETV